MNLRAFLFFAFLASVQLSSGQDYRTVWSLPIDPGDRYSFGTGGFLSGYTSNGRRLFHLGEDWNANDGSDFGDPVYAIADGVVIKVVRGNEGTDSFNDELHIEHELPGGKKIEAVYFHLSEILCEEGWKVFRGDGVGKIGFGGTGPHLHFEIRRVVAGATRKNSYALHVNRLSSEDPRYNTARDYIAPSVHIDDVGTEKVIPLNRDLLQLNRVHFRVEGDSRQSTAYITYNGRTHTLVRAYQKGYISGMYRFDTNLNRFRLISGNRWVFEAGSDYRITAKKSGMELHIPVPTGDPRFFATRARTDLLAALHSRGLYHLDIDAGELIRDEANDPWRIVKYRYFKTKPDFDAGRANFAIHALHKQKVILRYVHPDGDPAKFVQVNPNFLQ